MPNPFSKVGGATATAPVTDEAPATSATPEAVAAAKAGSVNPRANRGSQTFEKAGSAVRITDYAGELLAVYPSEYVPCVFVGDKGEDVAGVRLDYVVCSGADAGTEVRDGLILGKILVDSLSRKLGQAVILKLGQGEKKGKNSPPWISLETTPEEDAHIAKVVAQVYG